MPEAGFLLIPPKAKKGARALWTIERALKESQKSSDVIATQLLELKGLADYLIDGAGTMPQAVLSLRVGGESAAKFLEECSFLGFNLYDLSGYITSLSTNADKLSKNDMGSILDDLKRIARKLMSIAIQIQGFIRYADSNSKHLGRWLDFASLQMKDASEGCMLFKSVVGTHVAQTEFDGTRR